MKMDSIRKQLMWVLGLLLFCLCYYYFVLHLVEKKGEQTISSFRLEGFLFLLVISLFSIFCVRVFERIVSRYYADQLVAKYTIVMMASFMLFILVVFLVQYSIESFSNQNNSFNYYFNNMLLMGFLHLVVGNAAAGVSYFKESMHLKMEISRREKRQVQMELQILRQQLSPHFLFNSLNTLSSLISMDTARASEFVSRLASLYRYSTQMSREEMVELKKEIDFATDYFRLAQLRFGEIYHLKVDNSVYNDGEWLIIPMSMQAVIENVIKHNVASIEDPLLVNVRIEKGMLVVINDLRNSDNAINSLGVGLENLNEQSILVSGKKIVHQITESSFIVKIPLINKISHDHTDS